MNVRPAIATLAVTLFVSLPARAQVQIDVQLPTITFQAPPPLVVVQPGVQVVENHDEEIFVVDGAYWHRRDGRWFRARSYSGGWVVVEERAVPRTLVALPPGQYRHFVRTVEGAHVPPGQLKEHGHGNGKHGKH